MTDRQVLVLEDCPIKGSNLIEASAGTGKTYTIAGLFLRMVIENKLSVNEILVVTFTRAATEELKERIYSTLIDARNCFSGKPCDDDFLNTLKEKQSDTLDEGVKRIKDAIRDFDECAVFTIHGFCQRMLLENAFESGSLYDSEVITDQSHYILDAVQDFWRSNLYEAPIFIIDAFIESGIEGLLKLFGYRDRNPELNILGGNSLLTLNDVLSALSDYRTEYQNIKTLLPKSSEELYHLFELDKTPKLLNGTTYSPKHLPKHCGVVFDYLTSDQPIEMLSFPAKLELFTAAHMKTKLVKSNTDQLIPTAAIFKQMELMLAAYQTYCDLKNTYILSLKIKMFDDVEDKIGKQKMIDNVQSFNDFLTQLKHALTLQVGTNGLSDEVRKKYKAAMIDEFQDTDPVQYSIFNSLFSKDRILFLIGDPKQAIYSFRGADVYAYMKASSDVDLVYTLPKNYRSDEQLVEAVNEIFSLSHNPFAEPEIQYDLVVAHQSGASDLQIEGDDPEGVVIWTADTEKNEFTKETAVTSICVGITAEIHRLLTLAKNEKAVLQEGDESRPLQPSDFAILVRNRSEMRPLERLLTKHGIPCVLSGSSSVFDAEEAADLKRFLYAVQHPSDGGRVKAAMAGELIGRTAHQIDEMNLGLTNDLELFIASLKSYAELYRTSGFIRMFRAFISDHSVKERLISLENGERKLTNLLHLSEILHEQSSSSGASLMELYKWFCLQIENPALRKEETELRMETDENAVTIVTIHKSKGLEYPIVFAPFVWAKSDVKDCIYHADDQMVLQLGDDIDDAAMEKAFTESLSENMRLYYVALTRARHRCYTFWGGFSSRSNADSAAPAYLFHHGKEEVKDGLRQALKEGMKGMKNSDVVAHLNSIFKASSHVCVTPMLDVVLGDKLMMDSVQTAFQSAKAVHSIDTGFRVGSFSGLTRKAAQHDYESKDMDRLTTDVDETDIAEPFSIFDFQKGAKAGTFLHEYFEYLDFTTASDERSERLLKSLMTKYGFEEAYYDAVWEMKNNVLNAHLSNDFRLVDIGNSQKLNEMEFYFSIDDLTVSKLKEVVMASDIEDQFKDKMQALSFQSLKGHMTGFVDLIFEQGGKYYILDWKSNHMGNTYDAYQTSDLTHAMADHYYFLQYYIYSLALHRYLQQHLKGYHYETHFGGACYIFLRGVSPDANSNTGIYFDKPDVSLVEALDQLFGGSIDASGEI